MSVNGNGLVRVKLAKVTPRDRAALELKLVLKGKSLQGWATEQMRRLASVPLSRCRPAQRDGRRPGAVRSGRITWVSVRVPESLYRRARLRLRARGLSLLRWGEQLVHREIRSVDLDAAERAAFGPSRSGSA